MSSRSPAGAGRGAPSAGGKASTVGHVTVAIPPLQLARREAVRHSHAPEPKPLHFVGDDGGAAIGDIAIARGDADRGVREGDVVGVPEKEAERRPHAIKARLVLQSTSSPWQLIARATSTQWRVGAAVRATGSLGA